MRGADDVVLHAQVLEQELDRKVIVRLDAAYLRRREDDDVRPLVREERVHGGLIREIERGAIARHDIVKSVRFELPHDGATDQATMAGDKNLLPFFHEACGALYHFLFSVDAQSSLRADRRSATPSSKDLQALHRRQVRAERERPRHGSAPRRMTASSRITPALRAKIFAMR